MVVGKGTLVHTAERALHSVDGRDLDLVKHGDTGCRFLGLLNTKPGIVEGEEGTNFGH